ncbi:hypothetical protein HPP92_017866 [Vanilla planifolia]|uniref:Plus3 domain-containing protein n=1 Tax=Vanilla planifolia TaxID=51239 RepID=A0A835QBW7_VANPL|nr:hypothetical protein HPP92_017866 [Vanilla planifolia]
MDKNHQIGSFTTDDEANVLLSKDVQRDYQFIHESGAPQKESIEAKTNLYKNESADHCGNDLHMNGIEDSTNAKKVQDTPLCFWKNKFLDCQPSYKLKGIFLAVRKLRLSRNDITRLMKSSKGFNIGGLFLRLRLGKPDKGLGGTGYHVACINGSSSRSSISVCVGTSTYTVRSRFISNHDFEEHELKAWWLGKLRDGGRIPSKEELNDKLQMRIKLGF